jgi:hypothetical protein
VIDKIPATARTMTGRTRKAFMGFPLGNEARHLSGARFAEAKAATSCGQEVTNVAHPILCIPHQS